MTPRLTLLALAAACSALLLLACDEHEAAGPDDGDSMPPSILSVVGWDVNHIVLEFDERVTRESADNPAHYHLSESLAKNALASPALAGVLVRYASLHSDNRTVTLTTDTLTPLGYKLAVVGVVDTQGNKMTSGEPRFFDGTDAADTTPPEMVYQLPAPGADGVPTAAYILVGFSEAVAPPTFVRGLDITGEGASLVSIRYEDELHYACDLDVTPDTEYTVSVAGVEDLAGNKMADAQWTFHTAKVVDTTPPTVISTLPLSGAVNVAGDAKLSFTFSAPMDPFSVKLRPSVDVDASRWSNGFRTVTYENIWPGGQQYTVQIRPGEMRDYAGNPSTSLATVVFSTGPALETGSFSGRVIGDINSALAADPSGGLVFAGKNSPYEIYTSVVAMVGADDTYGMLHQAAGAYYPFYIKDSNGDGLYQPAYGDAVGIYGITDWQTAQDAQVVNIVDTSVRDVDILVYDPTAVYGLLPYGGISNGPVRVGLFETAGFDPVTSVPVLSITAEWTGVWDYIINSIDLGPIPGGSYYVAAYLDANLSGAFEPWFDPSGVYGGESPIAIDLTNGKDAPNISFDMHEPVAIANAHAVVWPTTPRSNRLKPFLDAMRAEQ